MQVNAMTEEFEHIEIFGKTVLFTNARVDRATVPDGWYRYDIRGSDYDPGSFGTLEREVGANHAGTILSPEEIPLSKGKDYRPIRGSQNFLGEDTGTYRAASAGGSGRNSCLPFMPFLALPPNLTPGTGHHIGWTKRSVFARMPLRDKLRVYCRQIVYAGDQQTHTTYGASASTDAGFDDSLPAMSLFADPPNLSMAAVCHTIWGKRSVFFIVPLG